MGSNGNRPTTVVIEVEIPDSLRAFVHEWAKHTGEKENEIVQSLFSHGLTSVCAVNDWKDGLVDRVAPILQDLVALSGEGTEILEIDLRPEAYFRVKPGRR